MPALAKLRFAALLAAFATRALAQDAGPGKPAALPATPPAAAAPAEPTERLKLPGLPNLAHVEGGIYRGGRPQLGDGGAESLAKLGIKKVIDLQGGDLTSPTKSLWADWRALILWMEPGEAPDAVEAEAAAVRRIGAELVHVPLDSLDPVTSEEAGGLERILALLGAASAANPVYVHCEHGKDRTGLVLALYRLRYDGWTPARAAAEMAELGHTGRLDELFTDNMDLTRVLALHPSLARPTPAAR